jgi:uncharacterized damage-inducible protein DinB
MDNLATGDLESLLRHMEWADALTWKTVLTLPDAQQDSRLREQLYHLHTVQWVYLQFWRGEPLHVPELTSLPDLAALASWAQPYYPHLRAFAQSVAPGLLSQVVALPWAAEVAKRLGSAGPATLGETVLQVVLHTTHHRAQIATRVRELGGDPPLTDFIAWVWKERPAPEWEHTASVADA